MSTAIRIEDDRLMNTIQRCKEDIAGFAKGELVRVVEIYSAHHVYVYGLKRGSGYIRRDLLEFTNLGLNDKGKINL